MNRKAPLKSAAIVLVGMMAASQVFAQATEQKEPVPQPRLVYVPGRGNVFVQPFPTDDPHAVAHTVNVPGYGEVYIVPVRREDSRSPRQRCIDEEVAREGGKPSDLAMGAIDLKCSQR